MLDIHLNRKFPCYGEKKPLTLKEGLRVGSSFQYVGFDPSDEMYYYDIIKEEGIRVPLLIEFSLDHVFKIYNLINRLKPSHDQVDPSVALVQQFGQPIQRIVSRNEREGALTGGLYNHYEYINRGGQVELYNGEKDLIKLIWEQLMSCFIYAINEEIYNYVHNQTIEEQLDQLDVLIRSFTDKLGTSDQDRIKIHFDLNLGPDAFPQFLKKYPIREEQKKALPGYITKIFRQNNPELPMVTELNIDEELIPIASKIHHLRDDERAFIQFKNQLIRDLI